MRCPGGLYSSLTAGRALGSCPLPLGEPWALAAPAPAPLPNLAIPLKHCRAPQHTPKARVCLLSSRPPLLTPLAPGVLPCSPLHTACSRHWSPARGPEGVSRVARAATGTHVPFRVEPHVGRSTGCSMGPAAFCHACLLRPTLAPFLQLAPAPCSKDSTIKQIGVSATRLPRCNLATAYMLDCAAPSWPNTAITALLPLPPGRLTTRQVRPALPACSLRA